MKHVYAGITTILEDRVCPHCNTPMEPFLGPPDSGWGVLVVCNNNECPHYKGSNEDIMYNREGSTLGCRYAEDPDAGYQSLNLLAVCR